MKEIVAIVMAAAAATSCGSNAPPVPAGSQGPGPGPVVSGRLAWSQRAPSLAAAQSYDYMLFVDGARGTLASPSCVGIEEVFECSAQLPQLPAGRHVLELTAFDRATSRESSRSAQLVVGLSGANSSSAAVVDQPLTAAVAQIDSPLATERPECTGAPMPTCFDTSIVAEGVGPVDRLVSLPDGRLLATYGDAVVRVLPDGIAERLQLDRSGTARIADIAVDRAFATNGLLYVAASAHDAAGGSVVSVVRMREIAGRFGEAATIAADLPAAGEGNPAIAVGPDARIYLALPSSGLSSRGGAYDGLVLRMTPDGAAAGYEPTHSPVLASGVVRPSSFGWLGNGQLLLASSAGHSGPTLGFVPLTATDGWPAPVRPIQVPEAGRLAAGIKRIAADSAFGSGGSDWRLYILGVEPAALYSARWAQGNPAGLESALEPIPLPGMTPVTFALADDGSLYVVARRDNDDSVSVLHLRPQLDKVASSGHGSAQGSGTAERNPRSPRQTVESDFLVGSPLRCATAANCWQ